LGSQVFLALLFGKFGSVTSVLVDQADRFKSLRYSRSLEKEADLQGLAILQDRRIDPDGFIRLFRHLASSASSGRPEFLASHPDIENRIRYIRNAVTAQAG
jgi:predicted Zn-dependent protease